MKRVLAIEGNPEIYAWLENTIRKNQQTSLVKSFNLAISDSDNSELSFYRHPEFSEWSRIASGSKVRDVRSIMVQSKTLDSLLTGEGWEPSAPLIIKIDIEGGEPRALRGLKNSLARARNYFLIVEFHTGFLDGKTGGAMEFADQLLALNSEFTYEINDSEGSLVHIKNREEFRNLVERCRAGTKISEIMTNIVVGTRPLQ